MKAVSSVKDIITARAKIKTAKNIAYEFQDFGVRLAHSLGDMGRKSFYIKLSKEVDRATLERARDFALGYEKAKSKAKVFMWYLKELRGVEKQKLI